jgi:integrase
MAQRITDKLVRGLEPPPSSNRVTYDADMKGFGIRITAAGARAFVLNYRAGGRERRYTIGSYPEWSVAAAREKAKELRRHIDNGEDPMAGRHAEREAPTVRDLIERYTKEHLRRKRPKSQREDRDMLAHFIEPKLGKLKVADVRHSDIDKLHQSLKSTPYRANRVVALLSKMFTLAIKWEMRGDNPARGVDRFHEEPRERFLSQAEIGRLTEALTNHRDPVAANAIRFLLLTGARKGETLAATWDQIDFEAGVWLKPSAHTKQRKEHRVPLSAPALQLLSEMKAAADPEVEYVFPGKRREQPLEDLKSDWRTLRKAAGIPDVRIHDLRHTYASILASAGLSLPVIGALLGHTQPGTTARYSHLFDEHHG